MRTSDSTTKLVAALAQFHAKVGKVKKDSINPHFKKSYASLSNILDTVADPLNAEGLVIIQNPEGNNELTTRLAHTSGEWIEATYAMQVSKANDPQALGSAITYARRYAIGSILSLNIDDDDDGNSASGKTPPAAKPAAKAAPAKNSDKPGQNSGQVAQADKEVAPPPQQNGTAKPDITEQQFKSLCERVKKGDKSVIEKASAVYSLTEDQLNMLNALTHPV